MLRISISVTQREEKLKLASNVSTSSLCSLTQVNDLSFSSNVNETPSAKPKILHVLLRRPTVTEELYWLAYMRKEKLQLANIILPSVLHLSHCLISYLVLSITPWSPTWIFSLPSMLNQSIKICYNFKCLPLQANLHRLILSAQKSQFNLQWNRIRYRNTNTLPRDLLSDRLWTAGLCF